MSLTIEWEDDGGALQVMDFDCVEREGHELGAEPTEHAVETGAPLTDHVRPSNGTVTLTAWISDTPLGEAPRFGMQGVQVTSTSLTLPDGAAAHVRAATGRIERVRAADAQLRTFVRSGQVLTVRPSWRGPIGPCVLARYAAERTAETGAALPATLELKEVRLATTDRAAIPAVRRAQRRREARGAQPAQATPPEDRRTFATRLFDSAVSALTR